MSSVVSAENTRAPRFINPPGLYDPRPNAYTHVVVAHAPARLVYVAGQGGEDVRGGLPQAFAAQVQQALHNLITALNAASACLADVVKLTVLIVDHDEERLAVLTHAINAAWGPWPAPACTLIPVPRLALDGMLFEIEATAVAPLKREAVSYVF
ncbi:RidA family protein [Variovorax sp. HJSM1_2]|uniref:RidA family protein n=1 Tax=Variovorax sp. HJSM1_2 TaxID=3366263 RepID=UPI003BDE68B9